MLRPIVRTFSWLRWLLLCAPLSSSLWFSGRAVAADPPTDFPRLVLDTGRTDFTPPDKEHVRLEIHGEYQLRWQSQTSFPLTPTATTIALHPGAVSDSIGQNTFLSEWIRITPQLQIADKIRIVGQADLTGLVVGDTTHGVSADATSRNTQDAFSNLQPRWLFVEWTSPVGLLRVGQQGAHWGMGIVANDGDHPSTFGDYRYGNIVEQVLFATKPFGVRSDFVVALAGNFVLKDNVALVSRGDHAWQGVLAAFYEKGQNMLGVYGVYRHQTNDRSADAYSPYADSLDVGVLDLAGHFAAPIVTPGTPSFAFGSAEIATVLGSTNEERTIYQPTTSVRQFGGAATLGVVLGAPFPKAPTSAATDGKTKNRPELFGRFVAQVEVGYASGDSNPNDGVEKRFVFDPNHKVGLLLFDEVMRFQTARSATAAQDPSLVNGQRPPPGVDLLPSNGGVFGAEYIYPTMIYRPQPSLDLKAGAVIAQTTADVVDPYRYVTQGAAVNYQGGSPKRHDLGVELDLGTEGRLELGQGQRLQLGAQGGVLFPGGALADATGATMKTQWIFVARAGVQF